MSSHKEKAGILIDRRKWELAENEIRQALVEDPEDSDAHAVLGRILYHREFYSEAVEALEKSLALNPHDAYSHYLLGFVWAHRPAFPSLAVEQLQSAEEEAKKALALHPHPIHYSLLATIQYCQENGKKALKTAEEGLALDPRDESCLQVRAMILEGLGREKILEQTLRQGLFLNPENPEFLARQGWIHWRRGEFQKAEECFRDSLQLAPSNFSAQKGFKYCGLLHKPVLGWILRYGEWFRRIKYWAFGMVGVWIVGIIIFGPVFLNHSLSLVFMAWMLASLLLHALLGVLDNFWGKSAPSTELPAWPKMTWMDMTMMVVGAMVCAATLQILGRAPLLGAVFVAGLTAFIWNEGRQGRLSPDRGDHLMDGFVMGWVAAAAIMFLLPFVTHLDPSWRFWGFINFFLGFYWATKFKPVDKAEGS